MDLQAYAGAAGEELVRNVSQAYGLEYAGAAGAQAERSVFYDDSEPLETPGVDIQGTLPEHQESKAALHRQFRIIDKEIAKYTQKMNASRMHGDAIKADVLSRMILSLGRLKRELAE